ncbi:hypothetical protein DOS70_07835 [Staphylococcus felis]|uniref:hypothetical protein n=1 Tax=Staphylococcus felis TaxID=46127 RepID=UPI000E263567|nr:hypothetical protein [Staphylococcus felis]REH94936.1 hypothetical protein DOS70_07835 [Staphylococcus felis]REH96154.1 hypothetical protein DOS67_05710 [Staphylococcus felis]REI06719.1 hypothetical protein DOS62_00225 [Staphylococcus felis]REI13143.1 hypothetical protein DOS73_08490 [Staphylococcus felis]REI29472.1 hypothetical protein DOS81_06475 [Staphylococcus felis]
MNKPRKVVDILEVHDINEQKGYIEKDLIVRLSKIYSSKEIILFGVMYFFSSIIFTFFIVYYGTEHYNLATKIIQFITPFYAITVGFSITTIVFVLNNLEKFNSLNKQTIFDIVILLICYISLSILSIMSFLGVTIFGALFSFDNNINMILNSLIFTLMIFDIFICFHLFMTIIKLLYLLTHSIIEQQPINKQNQEHNN